jgi:hypothetical protein
MRAGARFEEVEEGYPPAVVKAKLTLTAENIKRHRVHIILIVIVLLVYPNLCYNMYETKHMLLS